MGFDFGKIKYPKKEVLIIDPVDIFQKNQGKVQDKSINDLWLGQGDALREWNDNRKKNDVAIVLNTGAGKTLIGLLVSQSLVNETQGKVLYACGSIQLIKQTEEKAEGYGLNVTTYYNGKYSNDLYQTGKAACLTTYQAIFNGKSVFKRQEIEAVIFDDAHTAEGMIKNHFSLEIDRAANQDLYDGIISLFRPHYQKIGKITSFNEINEGINSTVVLLSPSAVKNNFAEIYRMITESGVLGKGGNIFSWEHLKDHLDLCSFLISSGSLQITPAFIPVTSQQVFGKGIRRVYLTATMLGADAFIRTFGQELDHVVQPKTTAGECERLILLPGQRFGFDNDVDFTKTILDGKKVLVLTSSNFQAGRWSDFGSLPKREEAAEAISNFKKSTENVKLILAGRYDGIDLPGDTCRHMVLDGLPNGTSLLDKYAWSGLNLANTLRSLIGCRIVQSLGRISRGMSDYGVVIITEKNYVDWLVTPKNMASLPQFVQKQVKLGIEVTGSVNSCAEMKDAMDAFLARQTGWLSFYETFMSECETNHIDQDIEILINFAKAEVKFSKCYWDRDFSQAAKIFTDIIDSAFDFSAGLGSWYCLWAGYCLEKLNDESFSNYYRRAYGATKAIPKYCSDELNLPNTYWSSQILNIANEFQNKGQSSVAVPDKLFFNIRHLDGSGTVNQIEESLRFLGQYLGLDSTRPDKEVGSGPDILWIGNGLALAIEAKTSKEDPVPYSKKYIGQLAQHINWVQDHHKVDKIIPIFVGPVCPASTSSSPSDDMMVTTLIEFKNLADRLISAYDDIAASAIPITLITQIDQILTERVLLWPNVVEQINLRQLKGI